MTNTILHIDSSSSIQKSVSRDLSRKLVDHLGADKVIYRDVTMGIPVVDEDWVDGRITPLNERTAAQKATLELSDQLIQEILDADTIVIGAAMYNFQMTAALKLWIDQVVRPDVTFTYSDQGQPIGLVEGKRVIVVMTSGGVAGGSEADFLTPYLSFALGFMGMTDVTYIYADRLAMAREESIEKAKAAIEAL